MSDVWRVSGLSANSTVDLANPGRLFGSESTQHSDDSGWMTRTITWNLLVPSSSRGWSAVRSCDVEDFGDKDIGE